MQKIIESKNYKNLQKILVADFYKSIKYAFDSGKGKVQLNGNFFNQDMQEIKYKIQFNLRGNKK